MGAALPLQNCELIENKLRKRLQGCWRKFLRECKDRDAGKRGEIAPADFLGASTCGPDRTASPPRPGGHLWAPQPTPGSGDEDSCCLGPAQQVRTRSIKSAHVPFSPRNLRPGVGSGQNVKGDRLGEPREVGRDGDGWGHSSALLTRFSPGVPVVKLEQNQFRKSSHGGSAG